MNIAVCISKFYISRFDALLSSLKNKNIKIYLLCFDKESAAYYKKKVKTINLNEFINFDKSLKLIIKKKKLIDQIITCRPIFLKYLHKKFFLKEIFLLDSDIFFFSNPLLLKKEVKNCSIAYCKHDFEKKLDKLNDIYGKFNAGFIYIKLNNHGKIFLNKWIELCKEWCEFKPKFNKFSDQKYLENLKKSLKKIKIIKHYGINTAPWNLNKRVISVKNNKIYVRNKRLIFFHFHGLRRITNNLYLIGTSNYNFRINNATKKIIFKPYVEILSKHINNEYFKKKNSLIRLLLKFFLIPKKIFYNDFYIYKDI
jgi:hypothetical protein